MYRILTLEDTVRVPPKRFSEELDKAIASELEEMIACKIDRDIGLLLTTISVEKVSEGKIIIGDGAIYYDVVFKVLVYQPMIHEVVEGVISEVTEFGAFVNFGPMDGLIHVSQIAEDYMNYDAKNAMLTGKESHKTLTVGDIVRARIVAVSLKERLPDCKIGLTMRQPYLGKPEWIEMEKKQAQERAKAEAEMEEKNKGEKGEK